MEKSSVFLTSSFASFPRIVSGNPLFFPEALDFSSSELFAPSALFAPLRALYPAGFHRLISGATPGVRIYLKREDCYIIAAMRIKESDLHPHIKARMLERGISLKEIRETLEKGRDSKDARVGTSGKVLIYAYNAKWEGKFFEEKEITVYYKYKRGEMVLLTAKARYGKFSKEAP